MKYILKILDIHVYYVQIIFKINSKYLSTTTANLRGDMIQCYHQACDNEDVMLTDENIAFLGQTVDTLVATIDKLSDSKHSGKNLNGYHFQG